MQLLLSLLVLAQITPPLTDTSRTLPPNDWLLAAPATAPTLTASEDNTSLVLDNGLIRREFRIAPNAATVRFDNLMTGEAMLRGVKPEAVLVIDGTPYNVGGLHGQPEYAYLKPEWLEEMTSSPDDFQFASYETGPIEPRFEWKQIRHAANQQWPPDGVNLRMRYTSSNLPDVNVMVHYNLYEGIPLLAKWVTIKNESKDTITLDSFISERLAVVEYETAVESRERWTYPNIHVESDYAFHGMSPGSANETTYWIPDPQYSSQVSYLRETPNLLESRPPIGPAQRIAPGDSFEAFRTYELIYDSTDRERKGLALRKMYRTIAPWITENPILMHVRYADAESVRSAIDQCAEVGFEMVIMTFGSGFNAEKEDPDYLAELKELADYADSKGVELGGYSLLASRSISEEHDAINPETGKPGGAIFGNSPCLESEWSHEYFAKLKHLYETTGLDLLEHDGNYPGDVCASTTHPGHRGLEDSQWNQWKRITEFYHWCRAQGIYLNVPDWYFLNGSNKVGMGYREVNWSLPRERQIVLGRQNIYDGTWQKTPSMGWMFVPLVQYHGGGAAATLEPLKDHLDAYEAHLTQNFGMGVQACYRGPRLYDSPETKAVVKKWVDFFKQHRAILESDMIHLRRADGRDIDGILHVNPTLEERGLAMLFNPTDKAITRQLTLPLYYTGLTTTATIQEKDGPPQTLKLDRNHNVTLPVTIEANGATWLTIRAE